MICCERIPNNLSRESIGVIKSVRIISELCVYDQTPMKTAANRCPLK